MSVRDGRTEERTPAPAGKVSRILEASEAEVIGITPWLLEDLDGESGLTLARPSVERDEGSAGSRSAHEMEARLMEAEQRHRFEMQEAVERARKDAEQRYREKLEHEVEPWLRRMAASIEEVGTIKQKYLAESEEKVVQLSIAIAQRLLHREIQVDSLALLGLLRAAVDKSEMREVQKILLNPVDLEALAPHLAKLNLPPRVEVQGERSLERGAILIESTSGTLDASVASQLDEVERGFIDMLGKRGAA